MRMKRIAAAVLTAAVLSPGVMVAVPAVAGAHTATYGTSVTARAVSAGSIPSLCLYYTFPPTVEVCTERVTHSLKGEVSSAHKNCVTGRVVNIYRRDWPGRPAEFVGQIISSLKASGGYSADYALTFRLRGRYGPAGEYQARVPRTTRVGLGHTHHCGAVTSDWVRFGA